MGYLVTAIFAIAGVILVALGFALGDPFPDDVQQLLGWSGLGWGGIVLSGVAIFQQARQARPYTYDFTESVWTPTDDGVVLEIPKSKHKKGRTPASTTVYQPTDPGGYQEVMCGVHTTPSGTVRITASKRFSGRVVIK